MPQDAFTLLRNAKELDEALRGGRINKINQPAKEEVSFLIYTGKRTVKLVLNANASDCGVYFCADEAENPLVAPNFCMLLRKHLQSAEILGVSTVGFERVLAIRLRCVSDFSSCERTLYAEIMGKYSNLILVENEIILGALKTTSLDDGCKRIIFTGAKYALPPLQDKVNPTNEEALKEALRGTEGDGRALFLRVAGLAPQTAEMIAETFRGGDWKKHVLDFIFHEPLAPSVVEREGKAVDFTAYRTAGAIPFETLSEAQSYFYEKRRAEKRFSARKREATSAIGSAKKKLEKRLSQIGDKRLECKDAEENRIKGELITANLYRLTRGMKGFEAENYYDGSIKKIALDPMLSPADNAQKYYKKYRKQKRTLEALAPQEKEVRAELDYLSSLSAAAEAADDEDDFKSLDEELTEAGLKKAPQMRKGKKKAEIPYRSYLQEGFRIYAGRNNLQNDRLVRAGAPEDIWLHTQKYHSCHVLIKTEGKKVPDSVLLFAARLCAHYSDGKGGRVPVDYCKLKYVKKPPKSKAGFVIYSSFQTLFVDPL